MHDLHASAKFLRSIYIPSPPFLVLPLPDTGVPGKRWCDTGMVCSLDDNSNPVSTDLIPL